MSREVNPAAPKGRPSCRAVFQREAAQSSPPPSSCFPASPSRRCRPSWWSATPARCRWSASAT